MVQGGVEACLHLKTLQQAFFGRVEGKHYSHVKVILSLINQLEFGKALTTVDIWRVTERRSDVKTCHADHVDSSDTD